MTKPNDIPQDVWDKSHDTSLLLVADLGANIETIARAIMAAKEEEREECLRAVIRVGIAMGAIDAVKEIHSEISKLANNTNKD